MIDSTEQIDFEKEIEEFRIKKYVSSIETTLKNAHFCCFKLITLENEEFNIKCSVFEGIQIIDSSIKNLEKKTFESFEQLLGLYSKMYVKKYSDELYDRLKALSEISE